MIIGGIILSFWPSFTSIHFGNAFYGILLVFFANVPQSIASVYMEYHLKRKKLEIYWMWMWINLFEIVVAIPLVFGIIPVQGISIKDIPSNIEAGYRCLFFGHDSDPLDKCHNVGFWYLAFIFVLVADRVNQALIIKYNSASMMWLATTCAVPLANIAFSSPIIMGNAASHLTPFLIGGLLVVSVGLLLYRSTREVIRARDVDLRVVSKSIIASPN